MLGQIDGGMLEQFVRMLSDPAARVARSRLVRSVEGKVARIA